MHIEINAGGLGGCVAVAEYQVNISGFISDADRVVSSFKTVQNCAYNLNGGVGALQDAVDELSERILLDESRIEAAETFQRKSSEFLSLAIQVDREVAELVNQNRDAFYEVNPWLKPVTDDETPWYEEAWNWLCDTAETIKDGLESAAEAVADTLSKIAGSIVDFYYDHKKIIDSILIVVGAIGAIAAVIATGGLALAPLLGALGVSAAAAAAISTAVAVVAVISTVGSSVLNLVDIWLEIDNPVFNAWQTGLNIVSTVSNLVYSIGNLYNSIKKIDPQAYVLENKTTNTVPANRTISSVDDLTPDEVKALHHYSKNEYYENINNSLRGLETPTPENAKVIDTMRNALDDAVLPDDMVLYRGTSTVELGDLQDLPVDDLIGKIIPEDGFLSTSADIYTGKRFTKNMFITLDVPAGSHGLDISSLSKMPWEQEYLFTIGQKLQIINAEWIDGILNLRVNLL